MLPAQERFEAVYRLRPERDNWLVMEPKLSALNAMTERCHEFVLRSVGDLHCGIERHVFPTATSFRCVHSQVSVADQLSSGCFGRLATDFAGSDADTCAHKDLSTLDAKG